MQELSLNLSLKPSKQIGNPQIFFSLREKGGLAHAAELLIRWERARQHFRERIIMARKNDDNFYRRQQDEANRLSAQQNRHLADIARHSKSAAQELRKFRQAFETFAEAMLGLRIEPFQGAALSEAARGQVAEFDLKGFKETLLKGEALTVPGDPIEMASDPGLDGPSYGEPESMPYPKVDIAPKGKPKTKAARLGYGDVVAANDDFVNGELESGKPTAEVQEHRLVIGVDYSKADPAEVALIASRKTVESNDRWTIICDENETRKLLLEVESDASSRNYGHGEDGAEINQQRVIREKIVNATHYTVGAAAEMADAIRNGEHPPAMFEVPEVAPVKTDRDGVRSYVKQEVLPPGVTPKMMEEHPDFAERVRNMPAYIDANAEPLTPSSKHEVRIAPDGTGVLPTEPGEDIPVTMNGKEIGRATVHGDGTATVSIDGDKAIPTVARGGYTGVGLSENVVGGIVHQGIFSDIATADTEKRSLSQFAADADRRRRDGLASY